ncbi:SDR family oxidoreductase [Pseudooceanicola sp. 216_PA32_1]|uniref:SDR family oxidoreductase n=1 Tax=Pseudooceanicola pacificus TaxID=2676438 RepID=A0A844WFP2_9RHOB|nr:SDR family oxidoreductase [Pseudooceanicola pacificus]MWB78389.1 SDR family oxidoreductase [Pseudooceanicola pacificus]
MIIVTGGTHGIGRAAAEIMAGEGHQVLIAGRDAETGQAIAGAVANISFQQTDITDEAACRALVDRAMELGGGRIAGLVNNAGLGRRHVFAETTLADWDEVMQVNARSVYLMTRLALDGLIAARGSVVNISSIAGRAGEEELAIYTASKAAVIGLTQALALELGHAVRFNAVCPGQIGTRMMGRVLSDDRRRRELELRIPAGRIADPREVGEVIAWLISDKSSYVNGAVLPVDGGETAGLRTPRQLE